MKDRVNNTDAKSEHTPDPVRSSKYGGFKKRGGSDNNSLNTEAGNFKALGFRIGKDGPKVYKKTSSNCHCTLVHNSRMEVMW